MNGVASARTSGGGSWARARRAGRRAARRRLRRPRAAERDLEARPWRLGRPQRLCIQAAVARAVVGVIGRPRKLVQDRGRRPVRGRAHDEEHLGGRRTRQGPAVGRSLDEQRQVRARAPARGHGEVVSRPAPVAIGRPLGERARRVVPGVGAGHQLAGGALTVPLDAEGGRVARDVQRQRLARTGPTGGGDSRGSRYRASALTRGPAAIDEQVGAGHEGRSVARHEVDRLGDLGRVGPAAEGLLALALFAGLAVRDGRSPDCKDVSVREHR